MTPDGFETAVTQIMATVSTMTLATCEGGMPWATDVYFAADGFDLIFFSSPNSRHCRNLALNPRCAATVHPPADSWQEIKGLQIEGSAEPLSHLGDKARGLAAYLHKFPFARELIAHPTETIKSLHKASLYVLRPTRLHYLDNALGFGTRYCVSVEAGCIIAAPQLEKST